MLHAKNSKMLTKGSWKGIKHLSSWKNYQGVGSLTKAQKLEKQWRADTRTMQDSVTKGQWKEISRAYFINVLRTFHDLKCIQIILLKYAIAMPCLWFYRGVQINFNHLHNFLILLMSYCTTHNIIAHLLVWVLLIRCLPVILPTTIL